MISRPAWDIPILIVDDEEAGGRVLERILQAQGYSCTRVLDAGSAKGQMAAHRFPVVLTDLDMPHGDGLGLIRELKLLYPDVATVMVTGRGNAEIGRMAIDSGAYGYITKPVDRDEMLVSVENAIRRRDLEIENRRHREELESMVRARTSALWETNLSLAKVEEDLRTSREETIRRLAIAAEARDDETARHVERMSRYTELIASSVIDVAIVAEELRIASILHDVGKLGIPDSLLRKTGKLADDEYELMKTHTEIGYGILAESDSPLLQTAATIALTHHEKFDGSGYPHGLVAEDIPLPGRIAAIADVFDALTADRIYRPAFSLEDTLEIMKEGRGTHFDPGLLDVFFDLMPEVLGVGAALNDSAPTRGRSSCASCSLTSRE